MFIFGTVDSVTQLKTAAHWYCDGALNIEPNSFYQVYSIHYSDNLHVFPCVYAVLSNKKHYMYVNFFFQIKEYCGDMEP